MAFNLQSKLVASELKLKLNYITLYVCTYVHTNSTFLSDFPISNTDEYGITFSTLSLSTPQTTKESEQLFYAAYTYSFTSSL